jgi:7,8-dihydropterin-6-yl-methyl-4-(beta-D-ribofuranosyl)aminobenzene 5'-phosphate synthase
MRWVKRILLAVLAAAAVGAVALEVRFARGKAAVDDAWRRDAPARLRDVGVTRSLAVLPLVDWYPARPDLRGEPGVAYLVRTDHATILFDVGANAGEGDPSPLEANARRLGVSLGDADAIVISHPHIDHVGGRRFAGHATFSPGREQVRLRAAKAFTPIPMTYPGLEVVTARGPTVVAPGVATTGTIAGQLYMGRAEEQALAIHLEGKGIVLVVGCGHQGLERLLARAAQLFDEPVYGVIGGLHYPVPHGRFRPAGLDVQRVVAFGPLRGPTPSDVEGKAALLARERPGWVSLSAHDSSDEAIETFRRAFGDRYHDLRVGEWQVVASGPGGP